MSKKRNRFFLIKTRDHYEEKVAQALALVIQSYRASVYSILVPADLKGFIIVEAESRTIIPPLLRDVKHTRGLMRRNISEEEVLKLLQPDHIVFKPNQLVSIIHGPFKGMDAQVISDDGKKVIIIIPEWEHAGKITVNRSDLSRIQ